MSSEPRRLLAFTGIRSDFNLLSTLYQQLNEDPEFHFGLVVSGTHFSESHGETIDLVEASGLPIVARLPTMVDDDATTARVESAALLIQLAAPLVTTWNPDALLVAGDREDALAITMLGAYTRIPTVHFFGGDHASDGNVDNPVRHACSKLASLHMVSHEEHRRRLRALGEPDRRIRVIGSPALDRFAATPAMSRAEVTSSLGIPDRDYVVVIFHPILGEEDQAGAQLAAILDVLQDRELNLLISAPNSDAGHRSILEEIAARSEHPRLHFYGNLPDPVFVNLLRNAQGLIGNSSAGIIEAPSIPLGVLNVGSRQRGRRHASNVIFVDANRDDIAAGLDRLLSTEFQQELQRVESIYGDGRSAERARRVLSEIDLESLTAKTEDPLDPDAERKP